ncbi:MAG: DUF1800 domain-containing protein [Caldilineae bacterium]|nr:MAG: DUF1800 domain-containing protein [Caldilineae bacterium]
MFGCVHHRNHKEDEGREGSPEKIFVLFASSVVQKSLFAAASLGLSGKERRTFMDETRARTLAAPEEEGAQGNPPPAPDRRRLLEGVGVLGAAALAATLLPEERVQAGGKRQEAARPPAMRTPGQRAAPRDGSAGKPALPSAAVIALNRMGFGPRPGDIETFNALGANDTERLAAYVEQQLAPETIDDSEFQTILDSYGFETLNKSQEQLWADHIKSEEAKDWRYRRLPVWETERAAFLRALYSKRQLMEVLADFWHNHFNVYGWDSWIQSTFVHYDRDVIRGNMLGNFRQMLGDVARSPAMLYYLDNQSNAGGNPNENYARELFELHTLGAENYYGVRSINDPAIVDDQGNRLGYIDSDVYGATTCFTGWRIDTDTGLFTFDAGAHFPYQKIVLGQIIPEFLGEKDGDTVLDLLANHPGTARHIARKLCRRFISDNPPDSIVQKAADVFYAQREAPDQLKQVVRTILLSEEFATTWGEKIKRPFEFACSVLRATECNFNATDNSFFWWYNPMGQGLFQWHPPDGYPDVHEDWSSTMPMLQRWRFVNSILGWKIGGDGEDKDEKRIQLEHLTPATATTPEEIADFWSRRLLGYVLPGEERKQVVEFMAYGRGTDSDLPPDQITERLRYMVALILMSPSFQWR